MNSKVATNSQLNLKQKQTKQTTRTGTKSQKGRSHGGLSVGRRRGKNGGKGTIRSIIGRHKIDRGKLRIVWEMEKPEYIYV